MPLTPAQRAAYGPGWDQFSRSIREDRAGGQCECVGQCGSRRHTVHDGGRCPARNGQRSPITGSLVVLTTAHLPGTRLATRDPRDVLALCQLCHLTLDAPQHRDTRARNRANADPDPALFPVADPRPQ